MRRFIWFLALLVACTQLGACGNPSDLDRSVLERITKDVPLPPAAENISTDVKGKPGVSAHVADTVDKVLQFYRTTLRQRGWALAEKTKKVGQLEIRGITATRPKSPSYRVLLAPGPYLSEDGKKAPKSTTIIIEPLNPK